MATQPGFTVAETADRTANGLFLARLLKPRTALLFARNTVASFLAFAVDMLILWMLVQFGGAVIPIASELPQLIPFAQGFVTLLDDLRAGVTLSPPTPPPRISG